MSSKTRVGILGIGAVGGYFGGLLAERYKGSEIEIILIVRPSAADTIRLKGLALITPSWEKVIFPEVVATDPSTIGVLDYLICCTKSYDLEESLLQLKKSIGEHTVILPLLNGVDARDRIHKLYPSVEIWEGCVYIVARLLQPGVIKETGKVHKLYFGSDTASSIKLQALEKLFIDAGIDATLSGNIQQTLWEKFLFLSTIANMTTYTNKVIGEVLREPFTKTLLIELIKELKLLADASGINLPQNVADTTLSKIEHLNYDATSSMHSDFQKGGRIEYMSLTAYVCELGDKYGIETPAFDNILTEFVRRESERLK